MEGLSLLEEENDIISEIKYNDKLTKKEKIKKYKDYLLDDCNYRLPDMFLEFIAREQLDLKYTEEELSNIRNQYNKKKEIIEEQNKLGDIKENQEKKHIDLLKQIREEIIIEEI